MSAAVDGSAFDRRSIAKVVVGFAIAGIALYLLGSVVGWGRIVATLEDADPRWLVAAGLATLCYLLAWTKTWDVVLAVGGVAVPFRRLVPTFFAATFANYVTPFGQAGGEPFIAYVLASDTEANYEEALASVSSADLMHLLPFFTFAGFGFVYLAVGRDLPAGARPLLWGLAALAVGVPALVYVGWRRRGVLKRAVTGALAPIARRTDRIERERIETRIDGFYAQIERITAEPRRLVFALGYSYAGWVCFAAPLYFAARALGVGLDPLLVAFLVPASALAGIVPTPGGLGGVEAALVALLVALTSITTGTAAALALVYRAMSYWFALVVCAPTALYVTARV